MNVSNFRIFRLIITKAHYDVAKEERDGKGGFSASSRAIATADLVDPFVILYAPNALVFVLLLNSPLTSLSSFTTSGHFSSMSRFDNYSQYQILQKRPLCLLL